MGMMMQPELSHWNPKNAFEPEDSFSYYQTELEQTILMLANHPSFVMLTLGNLGGNVRFGVRSRLHFRGSRALSFLPLAHAYGCAFDMLVPLAVGTHVTILGKLPTPKLLLKAFAEVRPNLVICVPLILEKIYRNKLRPVIEKPAVRNALKLPGLKTLVSVNPQPACRGFRRRVCGSDCRWRSA